MWNELVQIYNIIRKKLVKLLHNELAFSFISVAYIRSFRGTNKFANRQKKA